MFVQVYRGNAMKVTSVYKWAKHFSGGRKCVIDDKRSRQPLTSRTDETLHKFIKLCVKIVKMTIRSTTEEVNIDRVTKILTENLDMWKVHMKQLTDEQKQRTEIYQDLSERQDDILGCVITGHMMRHGSSSMILKKSGKVHNGRLPFLHVQKSFVSPNQESKQCCQLFLIL